METSAITSHPQENKLEKIELLSLPIEIHTAIFPHLGEKSLLALFRTNRFFEKIGAYESLLLYKYDVPYVDKVGEYVLQNILPPRSMHRVHGIYAKDKRFFLSKERQSFLYVEQLDEQRIPFQYYMLYDAARLGNAELFLYLYNRYREKYGEKDIAFQNDIETLENAVKSRHAAFILSLFESPYSLALTPDALNATAKAGSRTLLEELWKKYPDDSKETDTQLSLQWDILNNAAQSGSIELVQWLLEEKYPIDFMDSIVAHFIGEHQYLIWSGIDSGNLELVQWLFKKYPIFSATNNRNIVGFLEFAVRSGNLELVKWLFEKYPERFNDANIQNFLNIAAGSGSVDIAEWLFEKHTKPNAVAQTTLKTAVSAYRHFGFIMFLLKKFSDVLSITEDLIVKSKVKGAPSIITPWLESKCTVQKLVLR